MVCVEIPVVEIIWARRRISDVISKGQDTNNMVSFGALQRTQVFILCEEKVCPFSRKWRDFNFELNICKQWNIGKSRVNAEK